MKKSLIVMSVLVLSMSVIFALLWGSSGQEKSLLFPSRTEAAEGRKIKITAGDVEVIVTLNNSKAADDLITLLPITTTLVERNNFAKSMRLPRNLVTDEATTRDYELGNLNYWDDGPSVSIVYNAIYEQTIVPVIPVGKAGEQAKKLANATGTVTLELIQ